MDGNIISYGVYLPRLRLKREQYLNALNRCSANMQEKTVADVDEDVLTMAVEASKKALNILDPQQVGVVTLASTRFPYDEKESVGTLVEALGLSHQILTAQHTGSTLCGTQAILFAMSLLQQTNQPYALVVIADAPFSKAALDIEHGFGAGACAFVLAKHEPGLLLEGVHAYAGEALGLRYRRSGQTDIQDIGVAAYGTHDYQLALQTAVTGLLDQLGRNLSDYHHVIFHQSDAKAAMALAKKMGCIAGQMQAGSIYDQVGDTGACAPLLGLCRVLSVSDAGERILVCSYGAGSGSQALSFNLSHGLRTENKCWQTALDDKKYIDYLQYLKIKGNI